MRLAPVVSYPAVHDQGDAQLRRGGHIVLAGVLRSQADEVRAAYAPWCEFDEDGVQEDWARISARKR